MLAEPTRACEEPAVSAIKPGDDLIDCALLVLHEPDPERKAELTNVAARLWREGQLAEPRPGEGHGRAPDRPARQDDKVRTVAFKDVPSRGKGGSLASRQALLHSLVHIESWAVDLSWDIIARFGADPDYAPLPRAFFDDWVAVAADEARHFRALRDRLEATGSRYGALPTHDGLWQSAQETRGSLPARLAVEHCTHEARGLDVLPQTAARFCSGGDAETAALLRDVVYAEEITHCAAGVRWLRHLHGRARAAAAEPAEGLPAWAAEARRQGSVEAWFRSLVTRHFRGALKPPFNEEARARAGFTRDWWLPVAAPPKAAATH